MKTIKSKFIALLFILVFTTLTDTYAQMVQNSFLIGANHSFGDPEKLKSGFIIEYELQVSISNYFSVCLSPNLNLSNYVASTYTLNGTTILSEKEMEISTSIPSISFYPKVTLPVGDDLIFFLTTGPSGYRSFSNASLMTTDHQSSEVSSKIFKASSNYRLGLSTSVGTQVYLNDKIDLILKFKWDNINPGSSMNNLEFGGDWNRIDLKSSIFSVSAGVTIQLFNNRL